MYYRTYAWLNLHLFIRARMLGFVMGGRTGADGSSSSFTASKTVYRDVRSHKTCRHFRMPVFTLHGKWGYPNYLTRLIPVITFCRMTPGRS